MMLSGELTGLRARTSEDAEILHHELYENAEAWVRASSRAWVPIAPGPGSPYAAADPAEERRGPAPNAAVFSIVELSTGELAGEVGLWGIDVHNRVAHVGVELRPAFRGRGLGADAVRVACRYGFALRGLHRMQLETLSDNHAMIAAAQKVGFTREGVARGASWMNGGFMDDVIFGLLAEEFSG
jgi:RimJ/RimL family protein N-acetyltransferase